MELGGLLQVKKAEKKSDLRWFVAPTPSVQLREVTGLGRLVEGRDSVAKIPGGDTTPGSRRLNLHPGALRAHVQGVGNIQRALVDHGRRTDRLVWPGLDREVGGVLSTVRGRLTPGPGVGGRGLHLHFPVSDQRDTDCKR